MLDVLFERLEEKMDMAPSVEYVQEEDTTESDSLLGNLFGGSDYDYYNDKSDKKKVLKHVATNQITDEMFELAFQMFLYIARCPKQEEYVELSSYFKFFRNSTPRMFLEFILSEYKSQKGKQENWLKSASAKMMEMLDTSLELDVEKLESFFYAQLGDNKDIGNSRLDLENCSYYNRCSEEEKYMKKLGNVKFYLFSLYFE